MRRSQRQPPAEPPALDRWSALVTSLLVECSFRVRLPSRIMWACPGRNGPMASVGSDGMLDDASVACVPTSFPEERFPFASSSPERGAAGVRGGVPHAECGWARPKVPVAAEWADVRGAPVGWWRGGDCGGGRWGVFQVISELGKKRSMAVLPEGRLSPTSRHPKCQSQAHYLVRRASGQNCSNAASHHRPMVGSCTIITLRSAGDPTRKQCRDAAAARRLKSPAEPGLSPPLQTAMTRIRPHGCSVKRHPLRRIRSDQAPARNWN